MRLAVANLKGGVGKTTSALCLAEAAAREAGRALLVDADPQGSAMRWADAAAADGGEGLRAVAVALPTADLARRLEALHPGYPDVVVDTPPGRLDIVEAAVRAADAVVVPTQATLMDLDRVRETLAVAVAAGRPAAVLLVRVRAGTRALTAARRVLDAAEVPVFAAAVPQREAIAAAYGTRPGAAVLAPHEAVLTELRPVVARVGAAVAQ